MKYIQSAIAELTRHAEFETGWYAVYDTNYDHIQDQPKVGPPRKTADEAIADSRELGLDGVRWCDQDGYLYVDKPGEEVTGTFGDYLADGVERTTAVTPSLQGSTKSAGLAVEVNPIGPNQTELVKPNGDRVFFSYKTPVAYLQLPSTLYVTEERHSVTTSKHVNQYMRTLHNPTVEKVPQAELEQLTDGMQIEVPGPNQTVVQMHGGTQACLFSYKTLVAIWEGGTTYVSSERYSNTTSKHVNAFVRAMGSSKTEKVSPDELEAMVV